MKEFIINNSLNIIKKENPNYTTEKIEEIKYGLVGLYLMITKTIIILIIAALLGILKQLILFTIIYNIIRMPSFGLHAKSSIACLISSSILFIGLPFICKTIIIPNWIIITFGIVGILLIAKNSPADTEKRPIINSKRRKIYKIISTVLSFVYVMLSLIIPNHFLTNCLILSLLLQCIVISPLTYRAFNMPYNNYQNYNKV